MNNVVCHGIPDSRPLEAGDVVNIDVTVYLGGVHGDCSETYLVLEPGAEPQQGDEAALRLLEVARRALHAGIEECGPGKPFSAIGKMHSYIVIFIVNT